MRTERKPVAPDKALERVQLLCSRSEQCSADIVKKLTSWGLGTNEIGSIIKTLVRDRFLDDARFAKAYCYDKFNFSGWGRRKISMGLWAKRVPGDLLEAALEEIDADEYEKMARRIIKSRVPLITDALTTREGRNKLLRFGVGRGYEMGLVIDVIRALKREAEDGDPMD